MHDVSKIENVLVKTTKAHQGAPGAARSAEARRSSLGSNEDFVEIPSCDRPARGAHCAVGGAAMPNEQKISANAIGGQTAVWLVLTIGQSSSVVAAFWERADAAVHAALLSTPRPGESVVLKEVVVQGSRRRCQLCGEPVVLDDPSDPVSWIHSTDANDLGDHTAEV